MVGVVLAGGAGSRMAGAGASKLSVPVGGRPMIEWPLRALSEVCERVAVVCKASTALPPLAAHVERWDEPHEPRHPLTGIVHALETARSDVLVCAADMPFAAPPVLRALLEAALGAPDALAVVARSGGRLEPALGVYRHGALGRLVEAVPGEPLSRTVERLNPVLAPITPAAARSVNTPEDLVAAEEELTRRAP